MENNTLLFFLLAISLNVFTQEQLPDMATDRPDQTEASSIVPHKHIQLESGFVYEFTNKLQDNITYNTSLFRYGLLKQAELRFQADYTGIKYNGGDSLVNGFAPLKVGTKIYITEEKGLLPEISVIVGFLLPNIGKKSLQAPYTTPAFRIAASHSVTEMFSLGCNVGAEWGGTELFPDYFYSLVGAFSVTDKLGAFIEGYGYLPEIGGGSLLGDGGLTYKITPDFQLDVSAGLGITKDAPGGFVNAGFSWRR